MEHYYHNRRPSQPQRSSGGNDSGSVDLLELTNPLITLIHAAQRSAHKVKSLLIAIFTDSPWNEGHLSALFRVFTFFSPAGWNET